MAVIDKAVAAVVRQNDRKHELLAFRHPLAGVQIPKGTVEAGEPLASAVMRELYEESGLRLDAEPRLVGMWTRVLDGTFGEEPTLDEHRWHVFVIEARDLPDTWSHAAMGSPDEEGLVFDYHWLAMDERLRDKLHPVFAETVALVLADYEPLRRARGG